MFEKALFATDLSSASFSMIGCTCLQALVNLGTEECVLAMCVDGGTFSSVAFQQTRGVFEQWMDEQKKLLENHGFKTATDICADAPAKGIPRLADKNRCSYIVLGSQGESAIKNFLLGSVTFDILQNSTVPVFLFRLKPSDTIPESVTCCSCTENLLDCVLFPTDFSENAEHAFQVVLELVRKGSRKVVLHHVQEDRRIKPHLEHRLEEFNRIDSERLDEMKKRLSEAGPVSVETRISRGAAVHEILQLAGEAGASLLVMGTRGRSNVKEIFLGSISQNVARLSTTPMILVPGGRRE
jgi:nucleotide-binding universal stress UspA family protein